MDQHQTALKLYHGTTGIIGDQISLRSNTGVGWNRFTLGNGFYTNISMEAAKLFAHLCMINKRLRDTTREPVEFESRLYLVALKPNIKLLDATTALDPEVTRQILLEAGVSPHYLTHCHNDRLTHFTTVADLLNTGINWIGNRNEYLTKALGYDALKIMERAWDGWEYYPDDIGVDWKSCFKQWNIQQPKTVIIYDIKKIQSFQQIDWENLNKKEAIEQLQVDITKSNQLAR